jgi:hypothetical protein
MTITKHHIEELSAIEATTAALKGPTSLHASLWDDPIVGYLARGGYITWRRHDPACWGPRFRAVELTDKGRAALRKEPT